MQIRLYKAFILDWNHMFRYVFQACFSSTNKANVCSDKLDLFLYLHLFVALQQHSGFQCVWLKKSISFIGQNKTLLSLKKNLVFIYTSRKLKKQ